MGMILRPDGRPYTTDPLPQRLRTGGDRNPTRGSGKEALASFTLPELPPVIYEDYEHTQESLDPFVKAVATAVQYVIRDPQTRPLAITGTLLKDLFNEAVKCWIAMRREMGYSKKKCCDILPRQFHQAKLKDQRPDQHADENAKGNMWGKDNTEAPAEVEVQSAFENPELDYRSEQLSPEMKEAVEKVEKEYSSRKSGG